VLLPVSADRRTASMTACFDKRVREVFTTFD
jgi:hypothetical protein